MQNCAQCSTSLPPHTVRWRYLKANRQGRKNPDEGVFAAPQTFSNQCGQNSETEEIRADLTDVMNHETHDS